MNWTELLNASVEENYRATDGLMALVEDADLDWKPATGKNWMTTGQLLMHLTNACGACCKGFLTGDWGFPEDAPMPEEGESMLPPAEALPAIDSVQAARDLLAADKQVALDMIAQAGEAKLAGETVAAPWEPDSARTYGEQFLGMVQHLQASGGLEEFCEPQIHRDLALSMPEMDISTQLNLGCL